MKIDIKGLIKLKKQYGIYAIVATPNTLDCAIAQVFQGTSTDVTVAESSIVRLSNLDSNPCFWYTFLKILPVRIIVKYWSPHTVFKNEPTQTVDATVDTVERANRKKMFVILFIIFVASIDAPKIIAQIISQIVLIIPAIPFVETSLLRASTPVSILVLP